MPKKTPTKEKNLSNDVDLREAFSQMFNDDDEYGDMYEDHDCGHEATASLLTAVNQQMQIALDLTRIIHGNNGSVDEEKVFATFKKAVQTALDVYPLSNFMEKFDNAL